MKCKKCGADVAQNSKVCPQCGAKISSGIPTWLIVLIVVALVGFCILPVIGIVAAMTIPTLLADTDSARNKAAYKKSLATLNQSLLMGEAMNEKTFSRFDDVWDLSVKQYLLNLQDIPNGIKMNDGTEVKYEKTGNPCKRNYGTPSVHTACAILTIDTNGFAKAPNKRTERTTGKYNHVNDQFRVLLYSTTVAPEKGTAEDDIINEYKNSY